MITLQANTAIRVRNFPTRPAGRVRRDLVAGLAALVLLALAGGPVAADARDPVLARARAVEARLQARVGLMVVDTGTGRRWAYHADARFPMASTVKALICAAALARGEDLMARRVPIRNADLVPHAPVMAGQVGEDAPLAERDAGIADIGQALAATLSGSWPPGASE